MATELGTTQEIRGRLNDLYWNSGRTIDEIVGEHGISRNTLYAAIDPATTGQSCAVCGGRVVFVNRTNRAARIGTCEGCGMETEVADRRRTQAPDAAGANGHRAFQDPRLRRIREGMGEVEPRRAAMIGGAAAIGALVGYAATRSFRS